MATKTTGTVNINQCVAMIQNDLGDYTKEMYERIFQMVISNLSTLNILHGDKVEVVYLTMDSQGMVDYSAITDYVEYTKIGIPINGKIWLLVANDKILLRDSGETIPDSVAANIFNGSEAPETGISYFAPHYYQGTYVDQLFGYGGGFSRSYFRDDKENKRFQFDTIVPNNYVIMEYKSTGVKATGASLMSRTAANVMLTFVEWRLIRTRYGSTRGEVADAKQDHIEAIAEHVWDEKRPTWQSYISSLSYSKQSIKRT